MGRSWVGVPGLGGARDDVLGGLLGEGAQITSVLAVMMRQKPPEGLEKRSELCYLAAALRLDPGEAEETEEGLEERLERCRSLGEPVAAELGRRMDSGIRVCTQSPPGSSPASLQKCKQLITPLDRPRPQLSAILNL